MESESESELEEEVTPNYWAAEKQGPHIQAVLNHRQIEGREAFDDHNVDRAAFEFCIHWQGQAAYHATWESFASLKEKESTGVRKVDNYFANYVKTEQIFLADPKLAEDEREKYLMECETLAATIAERQKVDRIIASHNDGEQQYLVKCEFQTLIQGLVEPS
jgi:chromodomain-helicase-DNA-binding protein 1